MLTNEFYEKEADYEGHLFAAHYRSGGPVPCDMPHFHGSIELAFVMSGACGMHVNAGERVLHGGEIGFANGFCPHFYRATDDYDLYVLVIGAQYLSLLPDPSERAFPAFMPRNEEAFARIKRLLSWASVDRDGANKPMKHGFINLLLGVLLRYYSMEPVVKEKNAATVVKIMQYIDAHFAEPISLNMLADKFGYTQSYLSGLFNAFAGMNLREYVNRRRIGEAIRLQNGPDRLPLCKIAQLCGFESQNTFYRAYARYADKS